MADRDQSHLDATRAQVNEVQNIMKNNVDKIMEREGKLSDLEGRADQLQASSKKRYYFWTAGSLKSSNLWRLHSVPNGMKSQTWNFLRT